MRARTVGAGAVVITLGLGIPAANAVESIGQGYVTLMGTYISPDDISGDKVDDGVRGGVITTGFALEEHWDVELAVSRLSLDMSDTDGTDDQTGLVLNLLNVYNRAGRFSPYLLAGAGYLNDDGGGDVGSEDNFQAQGGIGLRTRIRKSRVAFRAEALYRWVDANDSRSDWLVNAGFEIALGGQRKAKAAPLTSSAPPASPPPDADSDGDGVVDRLDKCPATRSGVTVGADGCPLAPPPDSDGDGVPDDTDKCPTTPRGAKVGPLGCSLSLSVTGVNFDRDSAKLLPEGERILDEAVVALKDDPAATVEIQGYTDSSGSDTYNLRLGKRRATSVKDYLVSQGIAPERLTVKSYGEADPVADNGTPEGRAANRRVVLKALTYTEAR